MRNREKDIVSKKTKTPKAPTNLDSVAQAEQIRAMEGNTSHPGRTPPRGPLTDSEIQAAQILRSADWNK
jgi:hypothetical protein